jgi:hypothetical protein
MSLSLNLSSDLERLLKERAAAEGLPPDQYAARLVERSLRAPKSWAEALAPLQEAMRHGELSEAEADRLFQEARESVWRNQRKAS